MTIAEQRLWTRLRDKRFYGFKFRRQHGIGPYIVDFYCASNGLIIEIDGTAHSGDENLRRDQTRESYLQKLNLDVVRYSNADVIGNMNQVLQDIKFRLERRSTSPANLRLSTPPYKGGVVPNSSKQKPG